MSEIRKDKLISCDGWPDCYQERNVFKPHRRTRPPEGVVAKVITRMPVSMAEITLSHLRMNEGYKESALVEGVGGVSANGLAFRAYRSRS